MRRLGGRGIDAAIEREALAVVEPAAVEAALSAARRRPVGPALRRKR